MGNNDRTVQSTNQIQSELTAIHHNKGDRVHEPVQADYLRNFDTGLPTSEKSFSAVPTLRLKSFWIGPIEKRCFGTGF